MVFGSCRSFSFPDNGLILKLIWIRYPEKDRSRRAAGQRCFMIWWNYRMVRKWMIGDSRRKFRRLMILIIIRLCDLLAPRG